MDTLDELAAALGDDANFATTTATSLGEKLVKASNLSDLTNTTTARSNLGLGSLAELSSIAVSNLTASAIQTSGESFADNDTSLMTSAAVQDKIESFGYTTNTGDMTGVSITASNPLDISQSNTTSGSYSATISLVASEFGGYLADMTDLVVGGTDELAVLDNGTLKRKQIDEIRLTEFDATGFSSGISFDGSTANGVLTFKDSDEATVESNLTFDGSTLQVDNRIHLDGASPFIRMEESGVTNTPEFWVGVDGGNFSIRLNNTGTYPLTINTDSDNDLVDNVNIGYKIVAPNLVLPASHSADKIQMYSGGNEKIGTEANTLLFTADNYKFVDTAGHNNLFINSSGKVGIGTTSPSKMLHIINTANELIYIESPDANADIVGADTGGSTRLRSASGIFQFFTGGSASSASASSATFAMEIDANQRVGIGTTAPYERLYVNCEDDTSPGIVSNPASTNGAVAYAIGYGDANRDYLCTWGMDHSSGGNVFGYGVKPDGSTSEAFINSADNANFKRGALYFDDELKFFNASAQTGTIDTSITMTERFRVDASGDGFFDGDVVAFSTTVSDIRLKDNVKTIDNALDKVMSLRGVEFDWNATSKKGQHDIGLIAQEVQKVLPEVVIEKKLCMGDMKKNKKDYKTVDYEKIVGVLVEAVKELKQEIEDLK